MKNVVSTCLALLFCVMSSLSLHAQDVNSIVNADDENKSRKVRAFLKKGPSARDMIELFRSETNENIVYLAAGMFLEEEDFTPGLTTGVVISLASEGEMEKTAAMAAFSPHVGKIVEELMKGTGGHLLAVNIMAAYERSMAYESGLLPAVGGPYDPARARGKLSRKMDSTPHLKKLLSTRKSEVMEMALITIGFKKASELADQVASMKLIKDTKVKSAWLYCMARLGRQIAKDSFADGFKAMAFTEFTSVKPELSNYKVRGDALMYTLWAAAAAPDQIKSHDLLPMVIKALSHRDVRIQFEAALALELIGDPAALPELLKLARSTSNWNIKVATLSAIGAIPDKKSFQPVLDLMGKEKGRLRQDANYALASICAQQHAESSQGWFTWWDENQSKFQVDPAATRAFRLKHRVQDMKTSSLTDFYGAGIISDRAVFVLDTSMSMKGEKIESLKETMSNTLGNMPDHMKFNIVDFGGVVNDMFGEMMDAQFSKADADREIGYFELTGGTHTYDAIEQGLRTAGVDTIVYLSDGSPVGGQFEDWLRIRQAINLLSKHRPVAMTTIYFSGGNNNKKKNNKKNRGNSKLNAMGGFSYQNWSIGLLP